MCKRCILVVLDEEKGRVSSLESEIRNLLDPSKNGFCVSFMNKITNNDMGSFDDFVKRKKPDLIVFRNIQRELIKRLKSRAIKKFSDVTVAADIAVSEDKSIHYLKNITFEEVSELLSVKKEEKETVAA